MTNVTSQKQHDQDIRTLFDSGWSVSLLVKYRRSTEGVIRDSLARTTGVSFRGKERSAYVERAFLWV